MPGLTNPAFSIAYRQNFMQNKLSANLINLLHFWVCKITTPIKNSATYSEALISK
ncbi:MAG: hypothetical protein RIR31_328 [Bacteroidota bacterium]